MCMHDHGSHNPKPQLGTCCSFFKGNRKDYGGLWGDLSLARLLKELTRKKRGGSKGRQSSLTTFLGIKDPNVDGKGCGDTALSPTQLEPGLSWSVLAENSMHFLPRRGGGWDCGGPRHPHVTVPPPGNAAVTVAWGKIKGCILPCPTARDGLGAARRHGRGSP